MRLNCHRIYNNWLKGAVFLEFSRINHSCDFNVVPNWNELIKRYTVHAVRDIPEGEEITTSYVESQIELEDRQKNLQDVWGFVCSCRLCSLPAKLSQEYYEQLERAHQLRGCTGRYANEPMKVRWPLWSLRYVEECLRLCSQLRTVFFIQNLVYVEAAVTAQVSGDFGRGRVFEERALEGYQTVYGSDSDEVIEYSQMGRVIAEENPTSMTSDYVPQGLAQTTSKTGFGGEESQEGLTGRHM